MRLPNDGVALRASAPRFRCSMHGASHLGSPSCGCCTLPQKYDESPAPAAQEVICQHFLAKRQLRSLADLRPRTG